MSGPEPPAAKPTALVKGVDYYMEGENLVFTSSYLLKRGYCCNSGCRHCPYGENMPNIAVKIVGTGESDP